MRHDAIERHIMQLVGRYEWLGDLPDPRWGQIRDRDALAWAIDVIADVFPDEYERAIDRRAGIAPDARAG